MRIAENSLKDLEKIGVYKIKNLVNKKVYIGSTKKSFLSRFSTHYYKLKTGNHKGYLYLQNSVIKYGIENFEFEILEICKSEECLEREGFWINTLKSYDRNLGYNYIKIPYGSPMQNEEVKLKMIESLKEGYKSGRIKLNKGIFKKGKIPWNAGIRYQSTEHLKVPKKKKGSRENFIKTLKEKQLPINVYNLKGELIKSYQYIQDIIEDSKNLDSLLSKSMILKNVKGRNGYTPTQLFNVNIQKSCKTGKSYKGLIFKYDTIAYKKSEELLESQEIDNQQPS
jgi:group I intron endonuclease